MDLGGVKIVRLLGEGGMGRVFRDDGVFIERTAYGNVYMGRWETLPDGVRVTVADRPTFTGWFANGDVYLPRLQSEDPTRDPLVFERKEVPTHPK